MGQKQAPQKPLWQRERCSQNLRSQVEAPDFSDILSLTKSPMSPKNQESPIHTTTSEHPPQNTNHHQTSRLKNTPKTIRKQSPTPPAELPKPAVGGRQQVSSWKMPWCALPLWTPSPRSPCALALLGWGAGGAECRGVLGGGKVGVFFFVVPFSFFLKACFC